jgi:hypothetical protein
MCDFGCQMCDFEFINLKSQIRNPNSEIPLKVGKMDEYGKINTREFSPNLSFINWSFFVIFAVIFINCSKDII